MITLTKLNGEPIVVNINQIQTIELIPESKIVFVNKEFIIVTESADDIISMVVGFNAKIYDHHKALMAERD